MTTGLRLKKTGDNEEISEEYLTRIDEYLTEIRKQNLHSYRDLIQNPNI
jgi:hypothetical protein